MLPRLEAEYESGYILVEDEYDHSPYDRDKNIFNAILNFRPCGVHGRMTRLTLVCPINTFSIDWVLQPDNARPIRFKHMSHTWIDGISQGSQIKSIDFGVQWTEGDKNHQEVYEIEFVDGKDKEFKHFLDEVEV